MSSKSALTSVAVLTLSALALTACQSSATGSSAGATPSPLASASASSTADTSGAPSTSDASVSAPTSSASTSGGGSGGSGGSGAYATSDSYAWRHPCTPQQLSVHVVPRSAAPSQLVIEVRNNGSRSCGLSYYPQVSLDNAQAAGGQVVQPLIPSGLGGAPAVPVYVGQTVYAVIDLDPSGATTGTVPGINELKVLPDGDHMPPSAILSFPLSDGALVLKPKLGLYDYTVADAVSSMQSADT